MSLSERLGLLGHRAARRAWRLLTRPAAGGTGPFSTPPRTSEEFWAGYNVTSHHRFRDRAESTRYFAWRSEQYFDYLEYMPVAGQDDRVVLDYGCGPGHDLVGFVEYSKPSRLIGMDVSPASLREAEARLALHGASPELIPITESSPRLPLPDASVDYIHCSGVLHHVPDPRRVLREFRRVLRQEGRARLMVYNYESVWLHLYAAHTIRFTRPEGRGLTVREAFRRSTDTEACPISEAWTPDEVAAMCAATGFSCRHLGNAVSVHELAILPQRFDAILNLELEEEHRRFVLDLAFDRRGVPYHGDKAAGIDACYELEPREAASRCDGHAPP
jgi:SAM-dependent methyltransferase